MKKRIYICHTYYHAYIACLKELNLPKSGGGAVRGQASLMLSRLSNDFGTLRERALSSGLFEEVIPYDEKPESYFPGLARFHKDRGKHCAEYACPDKIYQNDGKAAGSFCARKSEGI